MLGVGASQGWRPPKARERAHTGPVSPQCSVQRPERSYMALSWQEKMRPPLWHSLVAVRCKLSLWLFFSWRHIYAGMPERPCSYQWRYRLYMQMQQPDSVLFCPCHFCNQISRLNTCIHLSISHLAIKLSFHYRGAQTTSIRICFSKWISQIFERKEITLFSLTWCYYREDPPKQCGVNSDSPEPGYLINQGQHNLDQCQTTEDSQLYCCQSLSHPVPLSLTPQKICLDSKHKA